MSISKIIPIIFLLITIFFANNSAYSLNVQGYQFTNAYRYSFLDDAGFENFKRPLVLTTSFAHITNPLFITDKTETNWVNTVIKNYDLFTFGGAYRLDTIPATVEVETALIKTKLRDAKTKTTLGDSKFKFNYSFLKKSNYAASLIPEITFPTGNQSTYTTANSIGLKIRSVFEYHLTSWHFLGSAGLGYAKNNIFSIVDYRKMLLSSLGISYDFHPKWNVNLETNRDFTYAADKFQDEGDYYLTFKNSSTDGFSSYAGYGISGLNSTNRKNQTFFLGIKINLLEEEKSAVKIVEIMTPPKKEEVVLSARPIEIKTEADEKKLGTPFVVENIYFDNNKIKIKNSENKKIIEMVKKLKEVRSSLKHIVIEGFASKVGDSKRNQVLSLNRALEVQKYLTAQGVDYQKTSVVAFGDKYKYQDKNIEKNRRVQFRLYLE